MTSIRMALAHEGTLQQRLEHLFRAFVHLAEQESDTFNVYMSALYGVNRAFQDEATKLLRDYIAVIALMLEESHARGEITCSNVDATAFTLLCRVGYPLWISGITLCTWFLWYHPYLSSPASPEVAQAGYWEMTGNLSMLAPAMIAVGIASILVGKTTIYTSQVDTRAASPAHRLQLSFPLLSTLAARQAMAALMVTFTGEQTLASAEHSLTTHFESGAPVIDERGNLQGVLTLAGIQRIPLEKREKQQVKDILRHDPLVISPDETLDVALEALTSQRVSWAPVVDTEVPMNGQRVIGTLSAASIIRLYRQTLTKDSRRMRGLVEGTVMVETMVKSAMPLAHVSLREAHLPAGCLVVSIRRQDELLFPQGSIVILPDDIVTFLVNPRGEEQLQHYLTEPSSQTIEPVALD